MRGKKARKLRKLAFAIVQHGSPSALLRMQRGRTHRGQIRTGILRYIYQTLKGRRAPIALAPGLKLGAP